MKEYRSAIRSRNLIKGAFIELMDKKDIEKITVVDIVKAADISRNTFYAHYYGVQAVLEDIENNFIGKLNEYLNEAEKKGRLYDPYPLLLEIQNFIERDIERNRILITNKQSQAICQKIKDIFISRLSNNLNKINIKNKKGFLIFAECLSSGFIDLYKQSLMGQIDYSLKDITEEFNRIYINGIKQYC